MISHEGLEDDNYTCHDLSPRLSQSSRPFVGRIKLSALESQ